MERWSVEHRAFAMETYLKKQRFSLDSEDISSTLQYSSERVSLVAIFFLWGYLKNKVYEKKTRATVDLKTEHHGRSGSNFSQHAATSDAELPETLGGMCWQGTPLHRHYIQEVNVVIKMLWVKDNINNKFEKKVVCFSFCFNLKIVRFFCRTLYNVLC